MNDTLAALKAWLVRAPMGYAGFDLEQCTASVAAIEELEAENKRLRKLLAAMHSIRGDTMPVQHPGEAESLAVWQKAQDDFYHGRITAKEHKAAKKIRREFWLETHPDPPFGKIGHRQSIQSKRGEF